MDEFLHIFYIFFHSDLYIYVNWNYMHVQEK